MLVFDKTFYTEGACNWCRFFTFFFFK